MVITFIWFKLFFHDSTSLSKHFFPPWHETLYAGRIKLFAEVSDLFAHAVFRLIVVCRTASPKCILQRANIGSQWVLNRGNRAVGRKVHPIVEVSLVCAKWCAVCLM